MSDRWLTGLGPLVFGLAHQLTGSYRDAIISLVVFLAAGFGPLARAAAAAAGNPVPARI